MRRIFGGMELLTFYKERADHYTQLIGQYQRKKNRLGAARLTSFLASVILSGLLLTTSWILSAGIFLLCFGLFIYFVATDADNEKTLQFNILLKKINEAELRSVTGDSSSFDNGATLSPKDHPYTNDLDITGNASLFQYLNRAAAAPSREKLASWILQPADLPLILRRQEAVKELQPRIEWRQALFAKGQLHPLSHATCNRVTDWLDTPFNLPRKEWWQRIKWTLPAITTLLILLSITGIINGNILWLMLLLHAGLAYQINKFVTPTYQQLSKIVPELQSMAESIAGLEAEKFGSPLLQELQAGCKEGDIPASKLLARLQKILSRFDYRLNILIGLPLNILFFWDLHQYLQLQQWKQEYGKVLPQWWDSLSNLEALSSFANFAFNNPGGVFPEITAEHFHFSARSMGHPLLPASKRITNDVQLEGTGKIMLITGSNMAGKSTFLRTAGVNIILALAGAPVCAAYFKISPVMIWSSMRVTDNLEENISTFYAELKKLELILQQVNAGEKVFLLLDEILRGTNSGDRHTGSQALIRQLLKKQAVGMIATHDLPLTAMAIGYPGQVLNYHFDVQVQAEELYFDYRLKEGVCQSMNASLLMRKIGIEV